MLIIDYESKKFTDANSEICRMLGYSKEELLGLSITEIHPKESHKHVFKELKKQKNGHKRIAKNILTLRKDGSIFYADILSMHIISNDTVCVAGFFRDVSERQKLKKDLQNSETRYQRLIETIPSVVYIGTLNKQGETLYISPQVKKLYEYSSKKFLDTPGLWFEHIHPDDKILILQKMDAIKDDEDISMLEYRIITKSGKIKWVKKSSLSH